MNKILRWILPFRKDEFICPFDADDVEWRIQSITDIVPILFSFAAGNKSLIQPYFKGVFISGGFKLLRIINYKNSFLPVTVVQISETTGGTKISLKARLPFFVLLAVIALPIGIFLQMYHEGKPLLPSLLPFLIYIVAIIAFQLEAQIARKKLVALLNLPSSL